MRMIDADALIDRVYRERLDSRELIAQMIESAPTVEAEPVKHGHWIVVDDEPPRVYRCSVCKKFSWTEHDYCCYCGAKMDEEVNENEAN